MLAPKSTPHAITYTVHFGARYRLGAASLSSSGAHNYWRQVTGVLCDRRMPRRLKGKIYKTVVRPVALYAAECWPAATNHEKALHAMEMRTLRCSLGLTRLDHATNIDVRDLLQVAPIKARMQEARLRWFGHVMRRGDELVVRTALRVNAAGQRPRVRPKNAGSTD